MEDGLNRVLGKLGEIAGPIVNDFRNSLADDDVDLKSKFEDSCKQLEELRTNARLMFSAFDTLQEQCDKVFENKKSTMSSIKRQHEDKLEAKRQIELANQSRDE